MPFTGQGTGIQNANDVFFSNLASQNVLQYNAATSKWTNVPYTGSVVTNAIADAAVTEPKMAISNSPSSGQVLSWNGSALAWTSPAQASGGSQTFTYAGNLAVGTGAMPLYNDSGSGRTITSVRVSVATAPSGNSVIVDVNVNGSTIFPIQSQRATIPAGQTTAVVSRSASWASGQPLTIDVDQVGSTIAGADLVITVEYQ